MPEITSNTVYIVQCGPMEQDYYTMDEDGALRAHYSMKRAELFTKDGRTRVAVTLDEWKSMVERHDDMQTANEIARHGSAQPLDDEATEPVKYMIECHGCGEVFDDIQAAAAHKGEADDGQPCIQFTSTGMIRMSATFGLVREDEAF